MHEFKETLIRAFGDDGLTFLALSTMVIVVSAQPFAHMRKRPIFWIILIGFLAFSLALVAVAQPSMPAFTITILPIYVFETMLLSWALAKADGTADVR